MKTMATAYSHNYGQIDDESNLVTYIYVEKRGEMITEEKRKKWKKRKERKGRKERKRK